MIASTIYNLTNFGKLSKIETMNKNKYTTHLLNADGWDYGAFKLLVMQHPNWPRPFKICDVRFEIGAINAFKEC